MERYIGLDGHTASCTIAVVSETGKRLRDFPVETNAQAREDVLGSLAPRVVGELGEAVAEGVTYPVGILDPPRLELAGEELLDRHLGLLASEAARPQARLLENDPYRAPSLQPIQEGEPLHLGADVLEGPRIRHGQLRCAPRASGRSAGRPWAV